MARAVLLLLLLFPFGLLAQPTLLPEGERLTPIRLLEFRDRPGRFIFVGKAKSQYHVFDVTDGVPREILMLNGSVMFDGGSLALDLEGGRHLFVPSDRKYNYVGGRTSSYLICPDRAREALLKREFDLARLNNLGLSHLILEQTTEAERPVTRMEHEFLPSSGKLLLMRLSGPVNFDKRDETRDLLKEIGKRTGACVFLDPREQTFYAGVFAVLCSHATVEEARLNVSQIENLSVQVIGAAEDVFSPSAVFGGFAEALKSLSDRNEPFPVRMSAMRELLADHHQWRALQGTPEFAASIKGAHLTLTELSQVAQSLSEALMVDGKYKVAELEGLKVLWGAEIESKARLVHDNSEVFRELISPLQALLLNYVTRLRDFATDETYRLTFESVGSFSGGEALPLLVADDMLPAWLNWWMQNLELAEKIPSLLSPKESKAGGWEYSYRGGGVFPSLRLSGDLADVRNWQLSSSSPLLSELEGSERNPNPLIQLGVGTLEVRARKQVVTFVIQAEAQVARNLIRINDNIYFSKFLHALHASEALVPLLREFWRNNGSLNQRDLAQVRFLLADGQTQADDGQILERLRTARREVMSRPPVTGSYWLKLFIDRLLGPPAIYGTLPAFDLARYFRNVIDILNELIEDKAHVLKTEGTFMTVLNAAVYLQNELRNAPPPAVKGSIAIARKLRELDRSIQTALLEPLSYVQLDDGSKPACAILLSPDPWARWRERQ